MKNSKFSIQKLSQKEIVEINGGQYFKPSIDGSFLANEPSMILKSIRLEKKNHNR